MAKMDEATRKRVRAGRLMLAGKTPAEAAKSVGVARQTAYTWKARLDEGGIDALRSMATGRPAQLDGGQLAALRSALLQGAMVHDFGTELWTLKRVRALIERLYGVRFSEVHVWRLLGAMGFSSQKPERRAIERDEAAVLAWKRKTWPALKKVCRRAQTDRLHRRIGSVGAAHPGAHLGPQGPHADRAVPRCGQEPTSSSPPRDRRRRVRGGVRRN
jgi:transposase